MEGRFTVTENESGKRELHVNWSRLLPAYGAAALGLGLVLSDHYIIGTALLLWGAGDF